MRNAEQILADVAAAGGDQDPEPENGPALSGARSRALCQLAREYPDRYRELYEAEVQAAGGEPRRLVRHRTAVLVDQIRKLVEQGKLTDREIGEVVGLKRTAVADLRRAHGIPAGLGRTGRPSNWQSDRGRNISRERQSALSDTRPYPVGVLDQPSTPDTVSTQEGQP